MIEVIPAILPTSSDDLEKKLKSLPQEIERIHVDVLENDIWTTLPHKFKFEAHLMVSRPDEIIERWIDRGADTIIVHKLSQEIIKDAEKIKLGLGVELNAPISSILPLIPKIDFVHLMSIDALGTQGDTFEPVTFDRIKEVKRAFPDVPVSVDGGIKVTNYKMLWECGADRLIIGSGFNELWTSLMKN